MRRAVTILTVAYLAILLALWGLIDFDRSGWWPVTLFLFSPRWAVAVPMLVLLPLTLSYRPLWTLAYILHTLVIVFPVMGCQVALTASAPPAAHPSLHILSCNMGGGQPRLEQLQRLVDQHQIQVLMLQECPSSVSEQVFTKLGWSYRQAGHLAIGSRSELGEIQILSRHAEEHYSTVAAAACELQLPAALTPVNSSQPATERICLVCVHLPTFRPAFERARRFDGQTAQAIREMGHKYRQTVEQLVAGLDTCSLPLVMAGDFNVPVESVFYRDYWSDRTNALSHAGQGFRYTKFTRLHGIRIDHVLLDEHWQVSSASVGPSLGGDHRPVLAAVTETPR